MARTKTIINQEINGLVEDIFNAVLEVTDDELAAMSVSRDIAEEFKEFLFGVVWDVLEKIESDMEKNSDDHATMEYRKVVRYWKR